jgi:hypothetical protein
MTRMWIVLSLYLRARSSGARQGMVRDDFITLCAGVVMSTGSFGFGSLMAPEPAELKLARIRAGLDFSLPVRTLRPNRKIVDCAMVWMGAKGEPEIWCPAVPPRPEERAAPTS